MHHVLDQEVEGLDLSTTSFGQLEKEGSDLEIKKKEDQKIKFQSTAYWVSYYLN